MKTTCFFSLLILLLLSQAIHGQSFEKEWDALFNTHFPANGPGGTVLVAKAGRVIYRKAFGKANLELDVAMKPGYRFRIGSLTKQFTACAILKLAEEDKLSLQDDITRYIKDYPTQGHHITIEHLLTHTSGIHNYTRLAKFTPQMQRMDVAPQELVDFFKNEPLDFAPGKEFRYSNSGYILLGYIIEIVSGKTYEDYLQEKFFTPLGMKNTAYDHSSRLISNRAVGYQPSPTGYENAAALSMTLPYAAGALVSNVDDLLIWYQALQNHQVIRPESLAKAHSSHRLANGRLTGYGYGWEIGNVQEVSCIKHVGRINGFLTYALYLPQDQVLISILSNCNPHTDLEQIACKITAQITGKPYPSEQIVVTAKQQENYEGIYQSEWDGQYKLMQQEGKLFWMPSGGEKKPLIAFAKDKFFEESSLTILEAVRNAKGLVTSLVSKSPNSDINWIRIPQKLPKMQPIQLTSSRLEGYVGKYQFSADFILTITQEGGHLYGEAFGRKVELVPFAVDKFFGRDLDVQLIFHFNKENMITGLTKIQNGEQIAQRVE